MTSLGEFIQQVRDATGKSRAAVARASGMTPTALLYLERGRNRFSDRTLTSVLEELGCTPLDRAQAWRLLLVEQGHPSEDAERMARAKVGLEVAA